MVTPAEVSVGKKAFDWLKGGATYIWKLGKHIATLEERVTALEQALKKAPAESCPFCGAREQRLAIQGTTIMGNPGKQWTEDTWICYDCGEEYIDRKKI